MEAKILSTACLFPSQVSHAHETGVSVSTVDSGSACYAEWRGQLRLRRASPLSYFMVDVASRAIAAVPGLDTSRLGVVSSFYLGCLTYSIRFYKQITEEGRRFGSPVLFPETVFNSPLSHVVSVLGVGGPVYSQIGDKSSVISAIRTACCWIANGDADHVLVLGAEEYDPMLLHAVRAGRIVRKGEVVGEGAGALLIGRGNSGKGVRIEKILDGHVFHNRRDAKRVAADFLSEIPMDIPVLATATGWMDKVEKDLLAKHPTVKPKAAHPEAFTARALWDIDDGMSLMQHSALKRIFVPVWGLSHQIGGLILSV